jgi:GNAT superfamily N-acetyltransferase
MRNLAEPRHLTLVGTTADGRIVGFCDAGPNREEPRDFQGEVYAIYLLEEAQRQGLGRALFHETVAWLRRNELSSFLVWVLTGNAGARRFYEALGGKPVSEEPTTIAGTLFTEVAYGWIAA